MRASLAVAVLAAAFSVRCAPVVDLTAGLEVVEVSSGWTDAGTASGRNKIVPSISFRFKNVSDQTLSTLQANVLFSRVGESNEWGSGYVRVVGSEGLPPGALSGSQTVSCPKGYTGSEPRLQMLANPEFVDARIKIMAKYGSNQWKPVGEYTVERRLLAR